MRCSLTVELHWAKKDNTWNQLKTEEIAVSLQLLHRASQNQWLCPKTESSVTQPAKQSRRQELSLSLCVKATRIDITSAGGLLSGTVTA